MTRFGQPPIFWILGVAPPGISQEAARSSQGQPGAARSSQGQPEAARRSQGQPGAARSSQKQPGAARGSQRQPEEARSSQWQPGTARSSQGQPWGSHITSKDKPGAPNATPASNNTCQGQRSAPSLQLSTNRSAESTPPHWRSKMKSFVNRFVNKMTCFGQPSILGILGGGGPRDQPGGSQKQPRAARGSQEQPETARGRQKKSGAASVSQE